MPEVRISLLLLAGMLAQMTCRASDAETLALQINPFSRPVLEAVTTEPGKRTGKNVPGETMQLRGTMLSGSNSVANIDGVIIGIGQHVHGYTLVSVQQRHVVLEGNGTQMTLSVDKQESGND